MELTLIAMFMTSIIIMIVVFLLYFSIRASLTYHNLFKSFGRIIGGSIIAGGGSGIILGFLLWAVLPTHYYITLSSNDGYYTRYVIDENLFKEYGRTFIVNLTDVDYFLAAMAYGDVELKEDQTPIIPIQSGYIIETVHNVDGWFKPFPEQVTSESNGKIIWHVLPKYMLISEYKTIGIDLTEE
ncbi:MAG: hypothetical protein Q4C30_00105 [Bacteroidia bacterium]|nr:hypothetical protein [Bacteroidia bacterium]